MAGPGATGNWIFIPVNRRYAAVTANIIGQDYTGLLMGEVSGNWTNTGARPGGSGQLAVAVGRNVDGGGGPERGAAVNAPHLVTPADAEIVVPVTVAGVADKGII